MNLADAICRGPRAERGERLLRKLLAIMMDNEAQSTLRAFVRWCAEHGVRPCPAHAGHCRGVCAVYGCGSRRDCEALTAIAELHDSRGLSNPGRDGGGAS